VAATAYAPTDEQAHAPGADPHPWMRTHERWLVKLRKALGFALTLNFMAFWAIPIASQGQAFKLALHKVLRPIYALIDQNPKIRRFAAEHVYRKPVHVDYFATAIFFVAGTVISLATLFYWQISHGSLPWWLVAVYFFAWVGFGGRGMGAAYTFAHREGHLAGGRMYRPWIRDHIGNFFENWAGYFYGNVPYNFSTSHNLLHHRLNAGKGDPFYMWDFDRTDFWGLMLYQWRIFVYMTGWSSLMEFRKQRDVKRMDEAYRTLRKGFLLYWLAVPGAIAALLLATGSTLGSTLLFLFFIYLQPLCAMSFFLATLNIGFHGLIEFDENGKHIECIASSTILDGQDDSFGEDDHMAHHYFGNVEHVDLKAHQARQHDVWARHHATVFKELSIIELGIFIHLGQFEMLVDKHYVDYAGDLGKAELIALLQQRASRKEMDYEDYEFRYLPNLRATARELVRRGVCGTENQAYVYQAHHNVQFDLSVPR
jgi:hypothetical protein